MFVSVWLVTCLYSTESKPVFHNKQNPLTEATFVSLQVQALMQDVKDPVRLVGSLAQEAKRILTNARAYLLEIQMPERQLREDFRMSDRDITDYQKLWAKSVESLNKLEHFFRIKGQVNNNTCNR